MAEVSRVRVTAIRARAVVDERLHGTSRGSVRDILRGEAVATQSAQRVLVRVTAQAGVIDVDVPRLIVLTRVPRRAVHVVQETVRDRHGVVQAVILVVATVCSVVYPLVRMIIRVALIVLRQRFVSRHLRVVNVILVVLVVQTFVNVLLWLLLLLRPTVVIAYQIDRILIIRIEIRVELRRVARAILKGARAVRRVLIALIFPLRIISALIHHRRGKLAVLVPLTDATRPLAVVATAAILCLHTAGPGFPR